MTDAPAPQETHPPAFGRFLELSTDALPAGQRFDFWRDTVLNRTEPDRLDRDDQPFSGRLRCFNGTTGQMREGRSSSIILRRTNRRCRRDAGDEFLLSGYTDLEGGVFERPNAPALKVPVNQIVMVDMAQPFEVRLGRYRELNFRLPRGAVAAAIGDDPARLGGRPLPRTPLTTLLFAQIRTLADALPDLSDDAREAALDATTALALSTLRIECSNPDTVDETATDGMWAAAERFIGFNFGRHDLKPDALASALRCSRSHLYRLFERRGTTVMAYLQGVRLERCHALLANPSCDMPIGQIAYLCGFEDLSGFTRSFKRRYGVTPTDLRRRSREADAALSN